MAITPLPVLTSLPASAPSARPSGASRTLAGVTTDSAHVEEAGAQTGVSFGTAMTPHRDEQAGNHGGGAPNGQKRVELVGGNRTFVGILEETSMASSGRSPGGPVRRGFSGYLSRAINAYETNARVIHGSGPEPRGSTVSLTL